MVFLKKQWFLIGLGIALVIGFQLPELVLQLSEAKGFRNSVVAVVLFLMALPLQASQLGKTISKPLAPGLGILFNTLLLPLFAWPCALLLLNEDFGIGLLVAVAAPCTMASAAVWTRRAGGNFAAAILVTVVTNFFCFLTTPFWVFIFTGKDFKISLSEMIFKLALLVVLPMTLGQLARLVRGVGPWTTNNKVLLSTLAQCGILIIVCTGAAETSRKMTGTEHSSTQVWPFLAMLFTVNFVHIVILLLGIKSAQGLGLPRGDQIAVGFSGSQKTLMVGLAVALELGVSIAPMLVYHISQLFVDTMVADRFAKNKNADSSEQST